MQMVGIASKFRKIYSKNYYENCIWGISEFKRLSSKSIIRFAYNTVLLCEIIKIGHVYSTLVKMY